MLCMAVLLLGNFCKSISQNYQVLRLSARTILTTKLDLYTMFATLLKGIVHWPVSVSLFSCLYYDSSFCWIVLIFNHACFLHSSVRLSPVTLCPFVCRSHKWVYVRLSVGLINGFISVCQSVS